MLKRLFMAIGSVAVVTTIAWAGSEPNLKEGLWEITSKLSMSGMQMPSATHTQCITSDDLVPQPSQPGQECQVNDVEVMGNTVTWTMHCSGQEGEMTGTGQITYYGDSFKGSMKMTMPGSGMEMTSSMNGHRIGECD